MTVFLQHRDCQADYVTLYHLTVSKNKVLMEAKIKCSWRRLKANTALCVILAS